MKTSDIKTGDIYAYSRSNDWDARQRSILIIDGETAVTFPSSTFRREAPPLSTPHSTDAPSKRNYLAAVGPIEWLEEHREQLLAIDVAASLGKTAREIMPEGIPAGTMHLDRQIIAVAPAHVRKTWAEHQELLDRQAAARREREDLDARKRAAQDDGWKIIAAALADRDIETGGFGKPVQRNSSGITITPEALAALLDVTIPPVPTK